MKSLNVVCDIIKLFSSFLLFKFHSFSYRQRRQNLAFLIWTRLFVCKERGKIEHVKTKFGHIVNDFGERIFFHRRHLQKIEIEDLKPGMRVVYQTVPSHSKRGTFEAQYIFVEDSTGETEEAKDLDEPAEEFKEQSPEP